MHHPRCVRCSTLTWVRPTCVKRHTRGPHRHLLPPRGQGRVAQVSQATAPPLRGRARRALHVRRDRDKLCTVGHTLAAHAEDPPRSAYARCLCIDRAVSMVAASHTATESSSSQLPFPTSPRGQRPCNRPRIRPHTRPASENPARASSRRALYECARTRARGSRDGPGNGA
jgi:hypothetical protein